jgi:hypothetical protein
MKIVPLILPFKKGFSFSFFLFFFLCFFFFFFFFFFSFVIFLTSYFVSFSHVNLVWLLVLSGATTNADSWKLCSNESIHKALCRSWSTSDFKWFPAELQVAVVRYKENKGLVLNFFFNFFLFSPFPLSFSFSFFSSKQFFVGGKKTGVWQILDSSHHFICCWWVGTMQHKPQQKRVQAKEGNQY